MHRYEVELVHQYLEFRHRKCTSLLKNISFKCTPSPLMEFSYASSSKRWWECGPFMRIQQVVPSKTLGAVVQVLWKLMLCGFTEECTNSVSKVPQAHWMERAWARYGNSTTGLTRLSSSRYRTFCVHNRYAQSAATQLKLLILVCRASGNSHFMPK